MSRLCVALVLAALLLPLLGAGQASQERPCPGEVCTHRGPFTYADSLRGTLTPFRDYDVQAYLLDLALNLDTRVLSGSVDIVFKAGTGDSIQVDLFDRWIIDSVTAHGHKVPYRRVGNHLFVADADLPRTDLAALLELKVWYHGTPLIAQNAPWDGGFVFQETPSGAPWVGVACEGLGASSWWPCKDHLSDEPEGGMEFILTLEDSTQERGVRWEGLRAVCNGQLVAPYETTIDGQDFAWLWEVKNPINSYNITLNIAPYVAIRDSFRSAESEQVLPLTYWVLPENTPIAREHFQQTLGMLRVYEELLGPYAFYNDGFQVVETPYWGMEHQSCIAYGNGFQNNAYGFDFILIHESGHEWFGNSITATDHADLWVHEAFTTYLEALYLEKTAHPPACRSERQPVVRHPEAVLSEVCAPNGDGR